MCTDISRTHRCSRFAVASFFCLSAWASRSSTCRLSASTQGIRADVSERGSCAEAERADHADCVIPERELDLLPYFTHAARKPFIKNVKKSLGESCDRRGLPLCLREGARKIAEGEGIVGVQLHDENAAFSFVRRFLNNLIVGVRDGGRFLNAPKRS